MGGNKERKKKEKKKKEKIPLGPTHTFVCARARVHNETSNRAHRIIVFVAEGMPYLLLVCSQLLLSLSIV